MRIKLVSLSLAVALAGCAASSNDGPSVHGSPVPGATGTGSPVPGAGGHGGPSSGSRLFVGYYEYDFPRCTTGRHEYRSREELCAILVDETANNNCASEARLKMYQQSCDPSASTLPKPSPAPIPASASCFKPEALAAKGPEIPISSFIDGMDGNYRLTSMETMTANREGGTEVSISLSATADADKTVGIITCKDFSQAPETTIDSGGFRMPALIKRSNGALLAGVLSAYQVYGPGSLSADWVGTNKTPGYSVPSLGALAKTMDELHIYRINPTTFQIVAHGKKIAYGRVYRTLISGLYTYEPEVTASPR